MRTSLLCLSILFASAPALADHKKTAVELYDEGLRHYNVAEYPEAIASWKQAYLMSKKALLLFNIGQAYRLSGDCKQAMTFYESYEREEPSPKNQNELDQALALCKQSSQPIDTPVVAAPDKPIDKPVD